VMLGQPEAAVAPPFCVTRKIHGPFDCIPRGLRRPHTHKVKN